MKKISILIVALVLVALAVFVAVGLDSNQAGAFPSGFSGGCQTCHAQGTAKFPHDVSAHASFLTTCTNCHSSASGGAGTAVISKCVVCHGSAAVIAAKPTHSTLTCTGCHAAATTTTTGASTTTTVGQTTTTTAGGSTTTTKPPSTTTTTAGGSTTTTAAPSTTTTVPAGEPSFTG